MFRTLILLLINLATAATLAFAEPLPPPQKPADASRDSEAPDEPPPQGPALTPPQNAAPIPPQNAGASDTPPAPGSAGGNQQPAQPPAKNNQRPKNAATRGLAPVAQSAKQQVPVPLAPANQPHRAAAPVRKNAGKPPEFFAERRKQQLARKSAAKQRMRDFQAARAAAEDKLYQDWHERYLADTPVRVEYYRALARAYEADAALAYATPYYYAAGPPIIFPAYPIYYTPATYYHPITYTAPFYAPIHSTFFYWGW